MYSIAGSMRVLPERETSNGGPAWNDRHTCSLTNLLGAVTRLLQYAIFVESRNMAVLYYNLPCDDNHAHVCARGAVDQSGHGAKTGRQVRFVQVKDNKVSLFAHLQGSNALLPAQSPGAAN